MGQRISQYTLISYDNDKYYRTLLTSYDIIEKTSTVDSYIHYCELGLKFNNDYKIFFDNDYYKKHNSIKIYHSDIMVDPSTLFRIINKYLINDLADIVQMYCYNVITGYESLFASDSELTPLNKMVKSNIFRYFIEELKDFKQVNKSIYYLYQQFDNLSKMGGSVDEYYKIVNNIKYIILFDYGWRVKDNPYRPHLYCTIQDFNTYRKLHKLTNVQ